MGFFSSKYGVIPALDVRNLDEAIRVVEATHDIKGIVGYKTGRKLEINEKMSQVVKTIEKITDLPIIHDPQKEGSGTEFMCPQFINEYADAGIKSIILFPFSSPRTQKACVDACYEREMIPIGGFTLTQKFQFDNERGRIDDAGAEWIDERFKEKTYRGYLAADAPERAYRLYAELEVRDFVAPGNFPEKATKLKDFLLDIHVKNPRFYLPGIGKKQGGDPWLAMESTFGFPSYLLIGSSIHGDGKYNAGKMRKITEDFCQIVLNFEYRG